MKERTADTAGSDVGAIVVGGGGVGGGTMAVRGEVGEEMAVGL